MKPRIRQRIGDFLFRWGLWNPEKRILRKYNIKVEHPFTGKLVRASWRPKDERIRHESRIKWIMGLNKFVSIREALEDYEKKGIIRKKTMKTALGEIAQYINIFHGSVPVEEFNRKSWFPKNLIYETTDNKTKQRITVKIDGEKIEVWANKN